MDQQQKRNTSYEVTAPARHAAETLAKNFSFRELPGCKIAATVENLAKLIDFACKLPTLVPSMEWFVNANPWYEPPTLRPASQPARADNLLDWLSDGDEAIAEKTPRLEENLERLQESIRKMQMIGDALPPKERSERLPSPLAWSAVSTIGKYFIFTSQRGRIKLTERNIALVIDVCTDVFRIQESIRALTTRCRWTDKEELRKQLELMRTAIAATELVSHHLPAAATARAVVIGEAPLRETPKPGPSYVRERRELKERLANATGPRQEFQLLKDWRQHVAK